MYAIIATGGKQYRVSQGDVIYVEKLNEEVGAEVTFPVLMLGGDTVEVGNPVLAGASVSGKVLQQGKAQKIIVFKYKSKKNYRRKAGHRQRLLPIVEHQVLSLVIAQAQLCVRRELVAHHGGSGGLKHHLFGGLGAVGAIALAVPQLYGVAVASARIYASDVGLSAL